jgi:hypothetical protein
VQPAARRRNQSRALSNVCPPCSPLYLDSDAAPPPIPS